MPHRLFIAIALPENVRRRLALLVAHAGPGVRPVRAEQVHLTLHFLGDADDAALSRLASAITRVDQQPFTIELAGTGVFPPHGRPTVLWAGVVCSEPLRRLHGEVAAVLVACGFPVESRPWVPHVTLARLSPRVPAAWTRQFLERHRDLTARGIPVSAVRLYESMRTAAGNEHVPVAAAPLTPAHAPAIAAPHASIPPQPTTTESPGEKPVQFHPSGP